MTPPAVARAGSARPALTGGEPTSRDARVRERVARRSGQGFAFRQALDHALGHFAEHGTLVYLAGAGDDGGNSAVSTAAEPGLAEMMVGDQRGGSV
jgi:hypothetical protein